MQSTESNRVAIVIPTWNSAEEIEACIESALAQSPSEVVVVDNGSMDDTAGIVRTQYPKVRLLELPTNFGFAGACNRGFKATRSEFVLFLNDDARLEPGYLETLVRQLEANSTLASAVGKLVTCVDGERYIDSAGIELHRFALRPTDRGHRELDTGQFDKRELIFGPSAAAAIYRRTAIETLGSLPFDELLVSYYEDVDLAWRLNRAGWSHLYEPRAIAVHSRRGPDRKPTSIASRAFTNRYLVWIKNESPLRFLAYAPVAVPWELVRIVRRAFADPRLLADFPNLPRRVWKVTRNKHL